MTNTRPTSNDLDRVAQLALEMSIYRFGDLDINTNARLFGYVTLIAAANQMIEHEVHRARSTGQTWQQLANVLGTTRQAVQQRYGS